MFRRHFWQGILWGFGASLVMITLLRLFGAASFNGVALHGQALVTSALLWAAAFLLLGFAEEFAYRGYSQATLLGGMGFWPAAVLLSAIFGAVHYFFKPMENWMDGLSVGLFELFWCFTLWRTGTLWFAIGFHAMSDYADMVLFAQPNTGNNGQSLTGHLLNVSYHGPDWLTGGLEERRPVPSSLLSSQFCSSRLRGRIQSTQPHRVQEIRSATTCAETSSSLPVLLVPVLALAASAFAQDGQDWSEPFPPFRVAGSLYYVGTKGLANYLVVTPQGNILINSDLEANVPMIKASIEKLGFKFKDTKILLISHAHWGSRRGKRDDQGMTGATYLVMHADESGPCIARRRGSKVWWHGARRVPNSRPYKRMHHVDDAGD